jgi:hypothetical protein
MSDNTTYFSKIGQTVAGCLICFVVAVKCFIGPVIYLLKTLGETKNAQIFKKDYWKNPTFHKKNIDW